MNITQSHNQQSLYIVIEQLWQLFRNIPWHSFQMRLQIHNSFHAIGSQSLTMETNHHLRTILFRYGHELLRNKTQGRFIFSLRVFTDSWQKNFLQIIFHYKLQKQSQNMIQNKGKTGGPKTAFPERLIAMHLLALSGMMFRSCSSINSAQKGQIVFIFPLPIQKDSINDS